MKKIYFTFLFVVTITTIKAQEIKWVSFEEAVELNKKTPKKFLIDVYTDWCGYCKKMDRNTYENKIIANYVNTYFYAVKLNAEQKEDLIYKGTTFKFKKDGGRRGIHEFAVGLLQGKMSYPSTVFLNEEEAIIDKLPGYLTADIMEKLLVYIGKEKYANQEWSDFEKGFVSKLN